MAIDFPNSPAVDQEHTVGGITWKWNGYAWEVVTAGGGGGGGELPDQPVPWVRPADWLPISVVPDSFQGLFAVFDDGGNYVAVAAMGAYTVDWGDGTVENIASNIQANHQYVFANIPSNTATTRGYRQVVVKITPQAGQTLTTVDLNRKHSAANVTTTYPVAWLDLAIDGPSITSIQIVSNNIGSIANYDPFLIERVRIPRHAVTNLGYFFRQCISLQSVEIATTGVTNMTYMFNDCRMLQIAPEMDTSLVTSMTHMFDGCNRLLSVPLYDTSKVTNMSNMFLACYRLQVVPVFITSLVTTMTFMFSSCYALRSPPLLDTSLVTDVSQMFSNCRSLVEVPPYNTGAAITMASMFQNCSRLQSVPLFNTINVTSMASMFAACASLQRLPTFNTANVTTMQSMMTDCFSLEEVPPFDTSKVTNMATLVDGCASLRRFPLLDTSKVTNITGMFGDCIGLREIPALNFSAVTTAGTGVFLLCFGLTKILMTGLKVTVQLYGSLTPAELDRVYTNLGTATAQTITVTNVMGKNADTPSIATAKGWTVTGS